MRGDDFDFFKFRLFMHYPQDFDIPENIMRLIKDTLLPNLFETPALFQYKTIPISGTNARSEQIDLKMANGFKGPIIYQLLKNCNYAVVHLISINTKSISDEWESFVSYCFYNTVLQMSSDMLRIKILRDWHLPGKKLTQRYAPGYCGWPLYEQQNILECLQPSHIGVTMSESFSLQPMHSITGIYGIRTDPDVRERMPCYKCTSISCGVHDDFIREVDSNKSIRGDRYE